LKCFWSCKRWAPNDQNNIASVGVMNSCDGHEYENNIQGDEQHHFSFKLGKLICILLFAWPLSYLWLCCSCFELLFHGLSIQPSKSLNLPGSTSGVIHFNQFHTLIKEYGNQQMSSIEEWFPFVSGITAFRIDAILSLFCHPLRGLLPLRYQLIDFSVKHLVCFIIQVLLVSIKLCGSWKVCMLHNYTITYC